MDFLLFTFKDTQILPNSLQDFYEHPVLTVIETGYIQMLCFNRQCIMDYWRLLDQHIIQFIQWVFWDVYLCPAEEHWFFYTQHSPSSLPKSPLDSSIVINHTQLTPTCIQDHQCSILCKYSRPMMGTIQVNLWKPSPTVQNKLRSRRRSGKSM